MLYHTAAAVSSPALYEEMCSWCETNIGKPNVDWGARWLDTSTKPTIVWLFNNADDCALFTLTWG